MITLVTGPPCVGKSTYVERRAGPDDVIIDLDRIALALSHPDTIDHDYGDTVRMVAIAARQAATDTAVALHREVPHVWVITAYPTQAQRRYYRAQGAEIVDLAADPVELERRRAARPERNRALMADLQASPPAVVKATRLSTGHPQALRVNRG